MERFVHLNVITGQISNGSGEGRSRVINPNGGNKLLAELPMRWSRDFATPSGAFEPAGPSATEDVIERNGTGTEEDQGEGKGGGGKGKLITVVTRQSVVPVHFPDGNAKVDEQDEGSGAGEESSENQDTAQKLAEGRDVA